MNLFDPTPPRRVTLEHPNGDIVAAEIIDGGGPAIIFLSGYGATMSGHKASWLAEQCAIWGWRFIRFDYRGRGESGGVADTGTLTRHLEDITMVVDQLTDQPVILLGSSMGGWLALRYALQHPDKVAAILGLSAAPDFTVGRTHDLNPAEAAFIKDAESHLLLNAEIPVTCPVELLQGGRDDLVPVTTAQSLLEKLQSDDVILHLVKDAGHRFERPQDLRLLWQVLTRLREQLLPEEA